MPSRKKTKSKSNHRFFWPLLAVVFIIWSLYRYLFNWPIIVDELVIKAIVFALPVLVYVKLSHYSAIMDSFAPHLMKRGLLVGLAVAGIFGFAATILAFITQSAVPQPLALFSAEYFTWELLLALITSFFETLFFFSFVMLVVQDLYPRWSLLKQLLLVATIFVVFHLPNLLLNFTGMDVLYQFLLLFALALGEGLWFSQRRNAYSLVMIQAIWGLVLLLHF